MGDKDDKKVPSVISPMDGRPISEEDIRAWAEKLPTDEASREKYNKSHRWDGDNSHRHGLRHPSQPVTDPNALQTPPADVPGSPSTGVRKI
jgi:hypothetical protein